MTVKYDRDEFRKYLENSGAVEALSRVFLKLYELKGNRPKSSIKFIQDRIDDCVPSLTEYEKLKENLNAMGQLLQKLKFDGKLDSTYLAELEKIGGIANVPDGDKSGPFLRISARHSQIGSGNELKTDGKRMPSRIRSLTDESEILKEITGFLARKDTHKSLLQTHLTVDIYNNCKAVTAANSTTFMDCICSGLDIPESAIGAYATDADAYDKFKDLFYPIINDYHGYDVKDGKSIHPPLDWGDPTKIDDVDPQKEYIIWTRIRCIRNVEGYPLVPKMTQDKLTAVCGAIKTAFQNKLCGGNFLDPNTTLDPLTEVYGAIKAAFQTKSTGGDVKGSWYEVKTLDSAKKKELIQKKYILEYGDKFLESVGATNHWPEGRAVYINKNETFFVWINEEDHLRFISMDSGSKICDTYGRLKEALEAVDGALAFQTDAKLGFVSLCPSNLGNTIRASVMIKLARLTDVANKLELEKLIAKHNFEIRHQAKPDTIEISNKTKLGITEFESMTKFCKGIKEIIEEERK